MQERGHWGVLRMALLAQPELQSMQFNIRFENSGDKATQYIPLNNVKIHHQPKFATTAIQFMSHRRSYHTFHKWYAGHWLSFTSNWFGQSKWLSLAAWFKASIFKEDFLKTRVTQTSTPSTRTSHTDVSCHRLPTSCHLPCLAGPYQVSSISEHLVISVVSLHLVTWPSALCAPQALKRPT